MSDDKATIAFIRQHDAEDRAQLKNNPHLPVMLSVVDREYLLAAVDLRDAEIAKLRECAEAMAEALNESKRTHRTCEECWYSCPKSGECCDDRQSGCTCGADSDNERIDAALATYRASFPKPEAKP